MFHNSRNTALTMNPAQMMQVYNMVRPQDFDDDASVTSFVTLQSSTSNYLNYFYNKPFANGQSKKVKVKSRGIRKVLTPTKKPKNKNNSNNNKENHSKKNKKVKNGFTIHASSSYKNLASLDKPSDDHTVSTFTNTTLGTDSCLNTARPEHATETQLLPQITEVVTPHHVHKPTHDDIDSDFSNGSGGTRVSLASSAYSTYSVADLKASKANLFQKTEEYVVLGMTKHFVYNATIVAVILMFVWQLSNDATKDAVETASVTSSSSSDQVVETVDVPSSYQSVMLNLATALLLTRATVFSFATRPTVAPLAVPSVAAPSDQLVGESSVFQQQIQQVIDTTSASELTALATESDTSVVSDDVISTEVATTEASVGNQLYVRSLCDLQMYPDEDTYEYVTERQVLPLQALTGSVSGLLNRFSDLKFNTFGFHFSPIRFRIPPQVALTRGFFFFLHEKLSVPRLCELDTCSSEVDANEEYSLAYAVAEKLSALKGFGNKAREIHNAVKVELQLEAMSELQSYDY